MNKEEFAETLDLIRAGNTVGELLTLIQYFDSQTYSDDLERNAVNRMCAALAKLHAGIDMSVSRAKVLRVIEGLYWRTVK